MSEPFIAEIKLISFNFPPKGWAFANGQLLQINQNQALFSLIGTIYGGNGQTTFALPDLRGRVPTHTGNGQALGQRGGEDAHTVSQQELPTHSHLVKVVNSNANAGPTNGVLAAANQLYQPGPGNTSLAPNTIANAGASQPHENRQPYLCLNFVIALTGIFPSQN